jgi:hypothetical protein
MAKANKTKINSLLQAWPVGTVAVQEWLSSRGISTQLTMWYLSANWVESIGKGAYIRAGDKVDWEGGLFCLQEFLKRKVHIGAKSALELLGQAHFIRMGTGGNLLVFGEPKERLPGWFKKNTHWSMQIKYFTTNLFGTSSLGLTKKKVANVDIIISAPERAMFETLYLVPSDQSIDEAYLLMQGLLTLRPDIVQQLLESCNSIKVKRLFMHLAEVLNHPWLKHINLEKVNFGKGKRVIVGGGIYNPKYQLSLPRIKEDERDYEK